MDLIKFTKDLLTPGETAPPVAIAEEKETNKPVTYQDYGLHLAYLLGGSVTGLKVCLNKIYHDFKDKIKNNLEEQEELKKPIRIKLEEHKGDIERWENKLKKIREELLPALKNKLNKLIEERNHIQKNPQDIIGEQAGLPAFYIGLIILLFLTVYLFIFYTSASYSTFFKVFNGEDNIIVNAIFDARAISKALEDGVAELILILTIPSVFLGLGYLIHKFQEQKTNWRFLKIGLLIAITFLFDTIIAYEICEKVYNFKRDAEIGTTMPVFSLAIAISSTNFWLIIFAGFIVYLIWGFVFDFVIDSFEKKDKLKVALKEKKRLIEETENEIKEMNISVEKMTHSIDDARTQIKKLTQTLNSLIVSREFERDAYGFTAGWLTWMKGSGKTNADLELAGAVVENFMQTSIYNYPKTDPE